MARAEAVGLTLAEAWPRAGGPWPRVVASAGDAGLAASLAEALRAQGFSPLVLAAEDIGTAEQRLCVRSFAFGDDEVRLAMRNGKVWDLPYTKVRVLLRGTRHVQQVHTETTKQRKLSLGRAAFTGGLVATRKVATKTRTVRDKAEGFLLLYPFEGPTVALWETELTYMGLGRAMEPTRTGNFAKVVAALRTLAPQALYNDRLLTRAGVLQTLGGVLAAEQFFDVAPALLAHPGALDGAASSG